MSCRHARALIHALMDGTLENRAALDAHLAECPACRNVLADLQHLEGALRASLECPLDEARLERLTTGAIASAQEARHVSARRSALWPRLAVAFAVLLAFVGGLASGRSLWPREVVSTRTVAVGRIVPKVVERVVERPVEVRVEVPVVREVPVVHTRVVYRDRIVEVPRPAPAERTIILAQGPPVKAEEIVVRLPTGPLSTPTVTTELHPARAAEPKPRPAGREAPTQGGLQAPRDRRIAQAPLALSALGQAE